MAIKTKLLVLSQVYVPDPASVGQHMADAAEEMARRGSEVLVLTSSRGYENPAVKYPLTEVRNGVLIKRIPLSSFGKKNILLRGLAGVLFMAQCTVRGLFARHVSRILVSTSPPVCIIAALLIHFVRRTPITFWVMDLNPDQLIALGKLPPNSMVARGFDAINRCILRRADRVIALDRFMADRLVAKVDVRSKITVIPPWPHDDCLGLVRHEENPFRTRHCLENKRVIMFSGNLSICSPVTTLLQAFLRFKDNDRLVLMFIGGGLGRKEVELFAVANKCSNIIMLPYQPLAEIKYSLSAADVHLVSLGEEMSGIIHPCKVYGAMAVARPILFLGPVPSYVTDIMKANRIGWAIRNGDVQGAEAALADILAQSGDDLVAMGAIARKSVIATFNKKTLCAEFCDLMQ